MFSAIIKDAESGYKGFVNSIDELIEHIESLYKEIKILKGLGINTILLAR